MFIIISSIPSPPHFFIPGLTPSFSASPSHRSLPFLLQDWLSGFPRLFTDTSEHMRFLACCSQSENQCIQSLWSSRLKVVQNLSLMSSPRQPSNTIRKAILACIACHQPVSIYFQPKWIKSTISWRHAEYQQPLWRKYLFLCKSSWFEDRWLLCIKMQTSTFSIH